MNRTRCNNLNIVPATGNNSKSTSKIWFLLPCYIKMVPWTINQILYHWQFHIKGPPCFFQFQMHTEAKLEMMMFTQGKQTFFFATSIQFQSWLARMKTIPFLCTCSSVDWPPHPWADQGSDPAPTCFPGWSSHYPKSTPLASPSTFR